MIKPTPYIVQCKACGYQKIIAPRSDAIMPWERAFTQCPKCQSLDVKNKERLTLFDKLALLLTK